MQVLMVMKLNPSLAQANNRLPREAKRHPFLLISCPHLPHFPKNSHRPQQYVCGSVKQECPPHWFSGCRSISVVLIPIHPLPLEQPLSSHLSNNNNCYKN